MSNMKKVLSTGLAATMLASSFGLSAGALDFTDAADIDHADAVEKMVSLGIIEGHDDGTFKPDGILTRGEMAKMIAVALNGGVDPELKGGVGEASFNDIDGHWAEGYIEYCANLGIVAGMGDGSFAPDAGLTAAQSAKMLLVALGYDAVYEELEGELTWALNTNRIAIQKGLYDGIQDVDTMAPFTRDDAAQMLLNFCEAKMVEYDYGISGSGGNLSGVQQAKDTSQTPLNKFYRLIEQTGNLNAVSYNSSRGEYTFNVGSTGFRTDRDFSDLMGLDVTVMFRDKDNDGAYDLGELIYDIEEDGSAVLAEGTMTDFGTYSATKGELKFDDVTYETESTVTLVRAFDGATGTVSAGTDNAIVFGGAAAPAADVPFHASLLDNDNDGKVDSILVTPFSVQKVSFVGADSVTFTKQGEGAFIGSMDSSKLLAYEGIAEGDVVFFYEAAHTAERTATAVLAERAVGTISGTKTVSGVSQYLIDGTWYTNLSGTRMDNGDELSFVSVGSKIYFAEIGLYGQNTTDVLAVYDTDTQVDFGTVYKAKVILPDGTKSTVTVSKVGGAAVANESDIVVGEMYNYSVNSEGKYELTEVSASNLAGHDGFAEQSVNDQAYLNKKVAGVELADDAIVIAIANGEAKTYTGKQLKNAYGTGGYGDKAVVLSDTQSGFKYASLVVIHDDTALPVLADGTNFGYLVADAYKTVKDGENHIVFTIWTGSEEITISDETGASADAFHKGLLVSYDAAGEGLVDNVKLGSSTVGAVVGYDEASGKIDLDGTQTEIDEDTQIIYVDQANKKGVEGGSISRADFRADGVTRIENVRYILNADSVKLLIVDVNNNITGRVEAGLAAASATPAAITDLFANYDIVSIEGDVSFTEALTVPAGKQLNISGSITSTAAVTGEGSVKVGGIANVASAAQLQTKEVRVQNSLAADVLEAIGNGTVGSALILEKAASTATVNNTVDTSKFLATAGSLATGAAAGDGVVATLGLAAGDIIPAGTYVFNTNVNAVDTNNMTASSAWVIQP